MSDFMVERVARALFDEEFGRLGAGLKFEDASPLARHEYWRLARAAIAAMREPTAAMLAAAGYVWSLEVHPGPPYDWVRMIDAAVREEPPST